MMLLIVVITTADLPLYLSQIIHVSVFRLKKIVPVTWTNIQPFLHYLLVSVPKMDMLWYFFFLNEQIYATLVNRCFNLIKSNKKVQIKEILFCYVVFRRMCLNIPLICSPYLLEVIWIPQFFFVTSKCLF